jgi:hypothetical protein
MSVKLGRIKERNKLRVFRSRALRKTFIPKTEEVTGGWRKMHSGQLHDFY